MVLPSTVLPFLASLAALLVATSVIGAEMYRWVDDKGVVNYTPFPPPANIKNVETKKDDNSR